MQFDALGAVQLSVNSPFAVAVRLGVAIAAIYFVEMAGVDKLENGPPLPMDILSYITCILYCLSDTAPSSVKVYPLFDISDNGFLYKRPASSCIPYPTMVFPIDVAGVQATLNAPFPATDTVGADSCVAPVIETLCDADAVLVVASYITLIAFSNTVYSVPPDRPVTVIGLAVCATVVHDDPSFTEYA